MMGLGCTLIEREKSEQSHGFWGSLLSLPSWFSFRYCQGSHQSAWPTHHLLGRWAGHSSGSVGACRMVFKCAHQPLRPQRRQSCCFVSFLHSYSWKRELKRAQACLPSCIMTNSGQSVSWSPPWDIAHSTCPCCILHSCEDSMEAAHQATVPVAEELWHLSTPCPKMLNLI